MPATTSIRDRLLDSALERFASSGALATTLDDVRAGAGASVGAVYHHFPDKEALYDAVRERALADYQGAFAAELERHHDAEAGVRGIIRFHLGWCAANGAAAKLLLSGRPGGAESLNRNFFARIRRWWSLHAHYGSVRELDPLTLHVLWLGPVMELTRHWLDGDVPKPSRSLVNTLADAAWVVLKEER